MDFLDQVIVNYTEQHTSVESELLQELNRETQAKVLMPRMLSGHLQGRILSMISYMIRPKYVLEIGTYTGYSALCLAEGLQADGMVHTIDINDELNPMVLRYAKKAGLDSKIKTHIGNALDLIPGLSYQFDIVFIDADKINYSNYFDLVIDKIRPGGFIIADNVLWSGKILDSAEKMDADTKAIHAFNEKIQVDKRVENVLLPVRDGLLFIRVI
ncbi:MAG: O-methyltransferase [Bacteroidia bacterium]|nr:O-methyltransferase [Bacteroidia bacterium]